VYVGTTYIQGWNGFGQRMRSTLVFLQFAIMNHEDCHFMFQSKSCDAKIEGGYTCPLIYHVGDRFEHIARSLLKTTTPSLLWASSHGVPSSKSQVPPKLATPNMEAKSQLLSLEKPLKHG
jgi:hypothetical protein